MSILLDHICYSNITNDSNRVYAYNQQPQHQIKNDDNIKEKYIQFYTHM